MSKIEVQKSLVGICIFRFPDAYISMTISEAKKLSSDLHKVLTDEWQKPDVKHLDAKQIIADLDSRRRLPVSTPKVTTKRSMQDDIEGL